MMTESMNNLAFTFDDDHVHLEQDNGGGGNVIDLHMTQLRLLTERAGLLVPANLDRLLRRLQDLRSQLEILCLDGSIYENEILERCGGGVEIMLYLHGIHEKAEWAIEEVQQMAAAASNRKSSPIPVTSSEQKQLAAVADLEANRIGD